MIELRNLSVVFPGENGPVQAVRDVSLTVRKGEIYGIVGTSGAGKSTLMRTINLLQRPTSGRVLVDGKDVTDARGAELRTLRSGIGMIFQHFNLIMSRTVRDNVAFAMKIAGASKEETARRVPEILGLVGLEDKAGVYPAKLSGGQKQRVGIARALANGPEVLLCDEPTSALDLETTKSILGLLKDINSKLGITMVLITHEMSVVKQICDRVAVMTEGRVVEEGGVYEVFSDPREPFTRQLVGHTLDLSLPERVRSEVKGTILKLVYRGEKAEEPILAEAQRKYGVIFNILHGKIEYIGGRPIGILLVAVDIPRERLPELIAHLKERTAELEVLYDRAEG